MKQWRPRDWDYPTPQTHRMGEPTFNIMTEGECRAFELGADAMLKVLRDSISEYMLPNDCSVGGFEHMPEIRFPCKGFLVFIPEIKNET